jgi:hypothetical protein
MGGRIFHFTHGAGHGNMKFPPYSVCDDRVLVVQVHIFCCGWDVAWVGDALGTVIEGIDVELVICMFGKGHTAPMEGSNVSLRLFSLMERLRLIVPTKYRTLGGALGLETSWKTVASVSIVVWERGRTFITEAVFHIILGLLRVVVVCNINVGRSTSSDS